MRPLILQVESECAPADLLGKLQGQSGVVLLESADRQNAHGRYSFLSARPFLSFRSFGSRCEIRDEDGPQESFGNPWHILDALMARYEMLDPCDLPFPLGGCFGMWGYDLKNFVEPKLSRRAVPDLELPDCAVGFYSSLVAWDHLLGKGWIISTGLQIDGTRSLEKARAELSFWNELTSSEEQERPVVTRSSKEPKIASNISREAFLNAVALAQEYIRFGHIYQVNLSHRLEVQSAISGVNFYSVLRQVSPAPFAAYCDFGDFQLASSSPEMFLRMSGNHIVTRPIKGTRSRDPDPTRDAQLTHELQTSGKEMAELVMITDLLRNDLGRVCEYGSVQVPELARLERYAHVQHLVSTVEGRLRAGVTHFAAFSACFPGGSITGAPKIRAMEIIDELEPASRGPYTGALGYLGFNRESQLSIIIRTAICRATKIYFNVGAGIVADSKPEAEYQETLAKAQGFNCANAILAGAKRQSLQEYPR